MLLFGLLRVRTLIVFWILLVLWYLIFVKNYLSSSDSLTYLRFSTSNSHNHVTYNLTRDEIGIIIKSGYSTKDRLLALINTMDKDWKASNFMVAADYSLPPGEDLKLNGDNIAVQDVIAPLLSFFEEKKYKKSPRLHAYLNLTAAIANGGIDVPNENGWELDIMKHITGLEQGFQHLPDKKWYIMIDDDTFLLPTSLVGLLSTLDPTIPYYLGSVIGKKSRFAHGGSGIVLSHKALEKLFTNHPRRVAAAKRESITALWGDALVSDTLRRVGVRVKEQYSSHFNGEHYTSTRLRPDLFCTILIGFHHVGSSDMALVRDSFQKFTHPVRYGDLLDVIRGPIETVTELIREDWELIRENWDFINASPEDKNVQVSQELLGGGMWGCSGLCQGSDACLAWTFDERSKTCFMADWMTIGYTKEGFSSGINRQRASALLDACE